MAATALKYDIDGYGTSAYAAIPEIEYAPEPDIRREPEPRPRPARREQTRYGVSPLAILGFLLAGVMLVLVLLAYVRMAEVADTTTRLEERLEALVLEERKLQIAYEEAFDINEIEEYAIRELGMVKPADAQIDTIDVSSGDKAVVLSTGEETQGGVSEFASFIGSLLEYL